MAERRMIAKTIIGSDAFLDMPISTQNLYFHLNIRSADDDGFVNNPKSIMRTVGATDDDLRVLIAKKFVIPFDDGVIVIKHWRIHNYIQKDRYTQTKYKEHLGELELDENKAYRIPIVSNLDTMDTQVRLGKDRIGEVKIKEMDKKISRKTLPVRGEFGNVYLSDEEILLLEKKYGKDAINELIEDLSAGIESHGYKYKNHYAALRNWAKTKKLKDIQVLLRSEPVPTVIDPMMLELAKRNHAELDARSK